MLSVICVLCSLLSCHKKTHELKPLQVLNYVENNISMDEHRPLLFVLHGYGANEHDLMPLVTSMGLNVNIVSFQAPQEMGENRFSWFDIKRSEHAVKRDLNGAREARKLLKDNIDYHHQRLCHSKCDVYLLGFSQGAMLSLDLGLVFPQKIKGIAVLSGMLLDEYTKQKIDSPAPDVFISHGEHDRVIPIEKAHIMQVFLHEHGLKAEVHDYPDMAHQIGQQARRDLKQWFIKQLK